LPQLIGIARKFEIPIITIKDLIAYRMERERIVERLPAYRLPSRHGEWQVIPFRQVTSGDIHLAIVKGQPAAVPPPLVRVHSMSRTGDLLGFIFGETGHEIDAALARIEAEGRGVFLLMRHSEPADNV